jgi:molecular chaperone GrpE
MAPDRQRRRVPLSSETHTAAEVTRSTSAPDPVSEQPAPKNEQAAPEHFAADKKQAEPASQPEAAEDHEAKLEHDIEELTVKAEKADEYLNLAQRTKADFENYRRRASREAAAAEERGIVKLARELLPAVDDLDRAVAAAQSEESAKDDGAVNLVSGIKLVHAGVIAALARVGIEPYSPQGERFDPQHHEAVAQHPVEGAAPGTVVEVYQRGYKLRDGTVLRPARVVVAA